MYNISFAKAVNMLGEASECFKILFFFQLILQKELHVVYALSHVCGQDRTLLAGILLKIFLHEKLESLLLRTLNDREISMEGMHWITLTFTGTQISKYKHSAFFLCILLSLFLNCLFSFYRWSDYLVSCHHFSKYADGAVHESHSNKFCSPCTERLYIKNNGEQAVLWGDTLNCVSKHFALLTQLSTSCFFMFALKISFSDIY